MVLMLDNVDFTPIAGFTRARNEHFGSTVHAFPILFLYMCALQEFIEFLSV
jgi:hypothetical protein